MSIKLVEGRKLILGGVEIPHPNGLLGHSDADALLHAITDALLGAVALGDIGRHFPDTDPRYKGADSRVLLRGAVALLAERGWRPVNVDATLIAQQPKLAPHAAAMVANVAADLGIAGRRGEHQGQDQRTAGLSRARRGHRGAGRRAGRTCRLRTAASGQSLFRLVATICGGRYLGRRGGRTMASEHWWAPDPSRYHPFDAGFPGRCAGVSASRLVCPGAACAGGQLQLEP